MQKEIKRMSVQKFRDEGYLQEVNRLFFHPLGLALEVLIKCKESPNVADTGEMLIGAIWDYRDDPEGILFGPKIIDGKKIKNIERLKKQKRSIRSKFKFCDINGIQIK